MSKNLKIIQSIVNVARIVCTILFICSIVGGIGCVVGEVASLGVPVLSISAEKISLSLQEIGLSGMSFIELFCEVIDCAVYAVIFGFTVKYLKNELNHGTPFTYEGAKEILILGIISAALPVAASVIKEATAVLLDVFQVIDLSGTELTVYDQPLSAGVGLLLIAISFVLKYGAEQNQGKIFDTEEESEEIKY